MNNIKYSKKFLKSLELYGSERKSLVNHINDFRTYIGTNGMDMKIFNYFDVKPIGNNYFRIKFIPFRLIIKIGNNDIDFIDLFKRKGKSDYKNYNK